MPRRKTLTKKKRQRGGDGNINSILKSVTNAQTSGEKKPANTSTTMTTNMSQTPTLSAFTPGANISKAANASTKSANTMMKAANTSTKSANSMMKAANNSTKSANSMMKAANTRTNVKSDLSMDLSKLSTNSPKTNAANTGKKDALIKKMNLFKNNLETMRKDFESLMTDTAAAV